MLKLKIYHVASSVSANGIYIYNFTTANDYTLLFQEYIDRAAHDPNKLFVATAGHRFNYRQLKK